MADMDRIPLVEVGETLDQATCKQVADALSEYGIFILKGVEADTVTHPLREMLVNYFRQAEEIKKKDCRPETHYEMGWTPSGTERPRPREAEKIKLKAENYPTPFTGADPKERFMFRIGPRPETTKYPEFSAPDVVPAAFPEWRSLIETWGDQAVKAMFLVSRAAAIGFGLEEDAFTRLLHLGAHMFSSTGSNLFKYGRPGTVLGGWHDDFDFMSIHSKSNFPGLRAWTRQGVPLWVKVPDGCLIIQAGQQFEYLTGGQVLCGLHEVVANDEMERGIHEAEAWAMVPWRVSTTLFGHVANDQVLQPLGHFATEESLTKYPPMDAGAQCQRELQLTGMAYQG